MSASLKFSVVNLGCKVNKAETDSMTANLLAQGHRSSSLPEADLIIINTCTVTGEAEKKTRKALRRALRTNPTARVLVTGCAAVIDPVFYAEFDRRVEVVNKLDLVSLGRHLCVGESFPQRVSVKIQDGCDHACTYCIVHVARGKAWSRPLDEIVSEVEALEAAGIREIMLSGIDLGSYHYQDNALADLLVRLLDATSEVRFRISSIEPCSVTDATIDLIARAEGRICRHLHIPLQSGSSKVLEEMARPYDSDRFFQLIERLRAQIPSISLSTDIIVGFPGETEAEFQETIDLATRSRFSKIHAFPYSIRQGTPAAERLDQIDPSIKDRRLHALLDLAARLRAEDAKGRIGTEEQVLIEAPGRGMSESYFKVSVPSDIPTGSLVPLTLTAVDPSCIMRACKNE